MLTIPDILSENEVAHIRALIDAADWADGNATSGTQSALAKHNSQLPEGSPAAHAAGEMILDALGRSPLFVAAALPFKVYPPLFNRYDPSDTFDTHVDTAIRIRRGSDFRIRSDLSATLFLAEPESYEGGELIVEDRYGAQSVKLPAGHMLLYPASSLHRVEPVTRGNRVASFFWIQSMIRDDGDRRILFDLDNAVRTVAADRGQDDRAVIELTGVYHNLLRRWAEV